MNKIVHRVPEGKYEDIAEAINAVKDNYYDQYDAKLAVTDVVTKNGAIVITGYPMPEQTGEEPDFEEEEETEVPSSFDENLTDEDYAGAEEETEEKPTPPTEEPKPEEPDLHTMTRPQLEEKALKLGIKDPDDKTVFPNKDTIIEAIGMAKSTS